MTRCTIKADDFRGVRSDQWNAFLNVCRQEKIPVAVGFIANGLAGGKRPDERLIRKVTRRNVEIWNHGWRHWFDESTDTAEFYGSTLEDQVAALKTCQDVCEAEFGYRPSCFGPPFNRFDVNTMRAVTEFPEIDRVFDIPYLPGRQSIPHHYYINCDAADSQRRFNLERAFKHSTTFIVRRSPFVIQIHPGNHWERNCLENFRHFVRYVKASGYSFSLPRDLFRARR